MASNPTKNCEIPSEDLSEDTTKLCEATKEAEQRVRWLNLIFLLYFHVAGLFGLYLSFSSVKWATMGFGLLVYLCGALGTTAGTHRLWSHKCYKAKLPLQIILALFHSITLQKSVIEWCHLHRLHHKFADTEGDPHNASRGFWYSHIVWIVTTESDEVSKGLKNVDVTDLNKNPLLFFQNKFELFSLGTFCFALPTIMPMYFWGETFTNAWYFNLLRVIIGLHAVCCVNSVAHMWGYKPYDKNILSVQNSFVSVAAVGEGFHNYHHTFPWDYKASEFGNIRYNLTTLFIEFFAWVGWAYDLKTASKDLVKERMERTGDGTDLWGKKKVM